MAKKKAKVKAEPKKEEKFSKEERDTFVVQPEDAVAEDAPVYQK